MGCSGNKAIRKETTGSCTGHDSSSIHRKAKKTGKKWGKMQLFISVVKYYLMKYKRFYLGWYAKSSIRECRHKN